MRLTPDQDALIRVAAAVTGQSLTEFVTTAAVIRAEDTLGPIEATDNTTDFDSGEESLDR